VILKLAVAIIAALALIGVLRKWNAPPNDPSYRVPSWWVWGESWWRGYRATIGIGAAAVAVIAAATLLPSLLLVWFAAVVALFTLMLTLFLFNWPKYLVPPALREGRGILGDWLAARRTPV
jgi:hypothetical protein